MLPLSSQLIFIFMMILGSWASFGLSLGLLKACTSLNNNKLDSNILTKFKHENVNNNMHYWWPITDTSGDSKTDPWVDLEI